MKNKVLFIAPLAGIWIALYFATNKLVHSYSYFDYKTPFDSFFPFLPIFSIIYVLTYFFIFIPLFKT
ncbi:MAG: hypothetical protein ABIJ18_01380 [archaeon]